MATSNSGCWTTRPRHRPATGVCSVNDQRARREGDSSAVRAWANANRVDESGRSRAGNSAARNSISSPTPAHRAICSGRVPERSSCRSAGGTSSRRRAAGQPSAADHQPCRQGGGQRGDAGEGAGRGLPWQSQFRPGGGAHWGTLALRAASPGGGAGFHTASTAWPPGSITKGAGCSPQSGHRAAGPRPPWASAAA